MDIIENKTYTNEEIVKRWGELGFLEGFPDDKKETLARNYENMAHYLIYDDKENTKESFQMVIFPILRRITFEIPIIFDCRMLVKYLLNVKTEDIQNYVHNDVIEYLEKNKDKEVWETYFKSEEITRVNNIDLEAEICAALSEYIIHKLKK